MIVWLAMGQSYVCTTIVFTIISVICGIVLQHSFSIPASAAILFVIFTVMIYTSGGIV
jgi:hypothetical protein